MTTNINQLTEQLSPLERKLIPHLNKPLKQIKQDAELDKVSLLRALKLLEKKEILTLKQTKKQIIDLGTNGIYYKKNHLPERQLTTLLESNNHLEFKEAQKLSKLSDNEFKAALGALKDKALLQIKNGKLSLTASKEELIKKSLEEQLIELLPAEKSSLKPEQQLALSKLEKRKEIVELKEKTITSFKLTELGKQIAGQEIKSDLIEEVTSEIIKSYTSKQKFRKYDIQTQVPAISGGKTHFVNQGIEYGRQVWKDLGFKEMTGTLIQTGFWNFDALFTAQDHPVRDMHDTFFIKDIKGKLPDKKIVDAVKKAHEGGTYSKGWQYQWNPEEAKKVLLRTHTTCFSAQTLANVKNSLVLDHRQDLKSNKKRSWGLKPEDLPAKFFAIGWNFRNETVDWSHGFELLQTEGIVVDENTSFIDLLGYLKEFAKKMGFPEIRFRPAYFPYTEPSVEGDVWNEEKQEWVEYLAAGVFRPEVTAPLLGKPTPVLAWGPGFGRMLMQFYNIKDLREFKENDLGQLRKIRSWIK